MSDELWQPFAVHEQDEILEQLWRTMPALPAEDDAEQPALRGYVSPGRGYSPQPAPQRTGRACPCLTAEEHLSGGCA